MGQVPVRRGPTGFSSWRAIVVPANFLVLEDLRVFERKDWGATRTSKGALLRMGKGHEGFGLVGCSEGIT